MRKLLTILFSVISFIAISQNCPELGPNQILPCGVNTAVLTADLTACVGGTNPNQTTNYSVTPIPYVTQTNTGNQLFMSDDSQQGPFPIGFTFCFYGQTYTQFYVGSNGWISFSPGQPTTFSSISIPSPLASTPKNCIMGPWQDWHPGLGGQIRYQTTGVAPCRKLTVSWTNVPMFSCTSLQGTFHIVIYESSNNIENYIQTKPNCLSWPTINPGSAVQGLHNLTGTGAVTVPGRNGTVWTVNNDAYKYTPSGPPVTPVLTWYQVGNPIAIGTGPSIVVNPLVPTQYTCHFVYPSCNTGWNTCNAGVAGPGPDTVLVVPGPPNLLPANMTFTNPLCFGSCDGSATATPVNGIPAYNYLWSNAQTTQTITNLCPGVYTVTVTDANGCSGTSTVTLTNPPLIVAGPINFSDTICFNSTNEIYTVPNLGTGYTYTWSTIGGITYGQGTDSINVDWTGVSAGFIPTGVMVTASDANGCTSLPASIDLTVFNVLPVISPVGPFCSYDEFITLQATPIGGVFSGTGVTDPNFYPGSAIGTNTITYTYTQSSCIFDTTLSIIVYPQPTLDSITPYNPFYEICDGDSVVTLFSAISNLSGYNEWTFSGSTCQQDNISITFNEPGMFPLSVVHYSNGCASPQQQIVITVDRCPVVLLYIPNSFTPDGDEHNNIWMPVFTAGYDEYSYNLVIFNRWGETIFESNKANEGWDGTYNNVMCTQGIYVWRITYDLKNNSGRKEIMGNINLIR
jgi:gliding motility-associated-like protein